MEDIGISVKDVKFVINKRVVLSTLIVAALSIIFAGCMAYVYSDSLYAIFWSLVFGITLGVLINYFILTKCKIIERMDIKLEHEETEEPLTVMKIE